MNHEEEEREKKLPPPRRGLNARRGSVQLQSHYDTGPVTQSLLDLEIQCDIQDLVLTGEYAARSSPDETSSDKEKDISLSEFTHFGVTTPTIVNELNEEPLPDRKIKDVRQNLETLEEDAVSSSPDDTTPDKQNETNETTTEPIEQPLAHVETETEIENDQQPTIPDDNSGEIEAATPEDAPNPKNAHSQQHTLEAFATNHFRPQPKRALIHSIKHRNKDSLWSHSKKPIKQPLLKKLLDKPELSKKACILFEYIMKYMQDHPDKNNFHQDVVLTDCIFKSALENEHLKDEVFCQIIKQLTDNNYKISKERGWELMWLATGIFACSTTLLPEVTKFLRSGKSELAIDCMDRLKKLIICGQRKHPPHLVELEAIQHFTTKIFHMVYFPNNTNEAIAIDSCITAKEFCTLIGKHLKLKSTDGFSLFFVIADKVICIPEKYYFFDFVRHFNDLMEKALFTGKTRKKVRTYQLFFMKKLWINTFPGKDIIADVMFHYHQEIPKLLRGYHNCSKDKAAELAALQYLVKFGKDTSEFENIPKMLQKLLPTDMVPLYSPEDWKKSIVKEYKKHTSKTQNEAKIAVLQNLYPLTTFGSAFFDVKQISEPKYPKRLWLTINRLGISLIDPSTKKILISYKFNQIASWKCGNTFFHMTIGKQAGETKFMCETTLAYKLEDLLTSYIKTIRTSMKTLAAGARRQSHF